MQGVWGELWGGNSTYLFSISMHFNSKTGHLYLSTGSDYFSFRKVVFIIIMMGH